MADDAKLLRRFHVKLLAGLVGGAAYYAAAVLHVIEGGWIAVLGLLLAVCPLAMPFSVGVAIGEAIAGDWLLLATWAVAFAAFAVYFTVLPEID